MAVSEGFPPGFNTSFNPGFLADVEYIYAESDFPVPVGGFINLENKSYQIVGNVSIATPLRFPSSGGCRLFSMTTATAQLNYTGTGAMFDTPALNTSVIVIEFLFMTSNDTFFNIDGTANGFIASFKCIYFSSASMGTISTVATNIKTNTIIGYGQGFTFTANAGLTFSENKMQLGQNLAATCLVDVQGAQSDIQISDNFLATAGVNETLLCLDSALTTQGAVSVGNNFDASAGGVVFDPTGKTQADPFFNFQGNSGVPNSVSKGAANLNVPQTIAITVAGTYVRIDDANSGGTNIWTLLDEERFSLNSTTGEFTYKGLQNIVLSALATATVEKVGGGTDVISIAVAKNGTVLQFSESQTENTRPTAVTSQAPVTLSTNDTISFFTRNQTGTADVLITQMVVSIR